jgi:hypothetical protein
MGNDGEYLRRLGEGEIHGENLRFGWIWVGGLRGGERAAAFAVTGEGGSEGGGQLGPRPANPNSKVRRHSAWRRRSYSRRTYQGGARRAYVADSAAPLAVAPLLHLPRHCERRGQKGLFE